MKVISSVNYKGGVGKTCMIVLLAKYLTAAGQKVLVIDSDGQNSTTFQFLDDEEQAGEKSLARAIMERNLGANIVTIDGNLGLVPSSYFLTELKPSLNVLKSLIKVGTVEAEGVVRDIKEFFDFILIDTPPSLDGFVYSAVYASDVSIVPFTFNQYAIKTTAYTLMQLIEKLDTKELSDFVCVGNMLSGKISESEASINNQYAAMASTYLGDMFVPEFVIKQSIEINKVIDREEPMSKAKAKIQHYNTLCNIFETITDVPRPEKF